MITSKIKKYYLWFPILKVFAAYILIYITIQLVIEDVVSKSLVFAMEAGFIYLLFFYLLPIFILYSSHRKALKGKSITFNNSSWTIDAYGKTFLPEDMLLAEKYVTVSKYNNRFDWSLWGHYYYLVFITHDGSKITLPCLMFENLQTLNSITVIKKKKFFPLPQKDVFL